MASKKNKRKNSGKVEIDHQFFLSNQPALMPTTKELGDLLKSYSHILESYPQLIAEFSARAQSWRFDVELIRYEASGSGKLDWLVSPWFADEQEAADYGSGKWSLFIQKCGLGSKNIGLGVYVLAVITQAVIRCIPYAKNAVEKQNTSPNLSGISDSIIDELAKELGVSREELIDAIRRLLEKKPDLQQDVSKVIQSARKDPNAFLRFDGRPELVLKAEAIKEIPNQLVIVSPTKTEVVDGVEMVLRATDLDSDKAGWGALIPSIYPERVKLRVRIERRGALQGVVKLRGKVVIDYFRNEDGEWIPKVYELVAVEATDRDGSIFVPKLDPPYSDE
jgi:hypothetical protein